MYINKPIIYLWFFLILGIYIYCMYPGVAPEDSGELATAAYTLGIPHPSGYPLYTLAGKMLTTLIPWGSVAYRANFISALFCVVSLLFLYLICKKILLIADMEENNLETVCLVSTLGFGLLYPVWNISLLTEVITLNIMCFSILTYLSIGIYNSTSTKRKFYLFFFLLGLFLGNHHTLILIIPAFLYLTRRKIRSNISTTFIATSAALFMLGFSIYLFLPIRSFNNPYLDLGDTQSLANLVNHVLRKTYGSLKLDPNANTTADWPFLFKRLVYFLRETISMFDIMGTLICILGFVRIYLKNKPLFGFILLSFVFTGPIFAMLANVGFDPISRKVLERLLLPAYFSIYLFCFCSLVSIYMLLKKMLHESPAKKIVLGLALVFALQYFLLNVNQNNCRANFYTYFYAKDILRSVCPPAVLFSSGDTPVSSITYLQQVHKHRLDTALIYPAKSDWFRNQIKKRFPDILKGVGYEKGVDFAAKIASLNKEKLNIYSTHQFIFPEAECIGLVYQKSVVGTNYKGLDVKLPIPLLLTRFFNYQKPPFSNVADAFMQEISEQYPKIHKKQ